MLTRICVAAEVRPALRVLKEAYGAAYQGATAAAAEVRPALRVLKVLVDEVNALMDATRQRFDPL